MTGPQPDDRHIAEYVPAPGCGITLLFHKRDLKNGPLDRVCGQPTHYWPRFRSRLLLVWTELIRKSSGLPELTPAQAMPWINDPAAVIIDISPIADFNKGHIVNARHLPASRRPPDAEVEKLKDKKLLVVCRSGPVCNFAAASLRKMGAEGVAC